MKGLEGAELARLGLINKGLVEQGNAQVLASMYNQFGIYADHPLPKAMLEYTRAMGMGESVDPEVLAARATIEKTVIKPWNMYAARARDMITQANAPEEWRKGTEPVAKALAKSVLDVGTLTNFANVTGGQALGYISLDTRMARSTVRPSSFTLYQCLDKSLAYQVVDFWALAKATGGAPPGAAFASYTSVQSGSLNTSVGTYDMQNIVLKLALDGRALTTALAAQNNYVNVSEQENTNAALTVLETMNWASYHGNSIIFANQFNGISNQILTNAPQNSFDFYTYSNNYSSAHNWTPEITLYNLIYQAAAKITSYGTYGHITHAFMDPTAMGAFQALTVTNLNNIITELNQMQVASPIHINGDIVGMKTRFGHIQFPMDLFITARDIPVQAIVVDGSSQATTVNPTNPASVACTINTSGSSITGSNFNGSYTPSGGGSYMYAVASCNSSSLESVLTYSSLLSGVASGNSVTVTITRPTANDSAAYRVFRSGLGGCQNNASPQPSEFRYIGAVIDSGNSTTTFIDLNGGAAAGTAPTCKIPGSSDIFLLDMDPYDLAIDFRLLLPLVRVELFASNLFMPWAVASIGSVRLRVPTFHGLIRNYCPTNPTWNPLSIN